MPSSAVSTYSWMRRSDKVCAKDNRSCCVTILCVGAKADFFFFLPKASSQ